LKPAKAPSRRWHGNLKKSWEFTQSLARALPTSGTNYRHGGAVDLQFFAVHEFSGEIVNRIYHEVRWTRLEDLPGYEFLAADRGLIRDLAEGKLL